MSEPTINDIVNDLRGREAAMRGVLLSLIATHQDKKTLLLALEKTRDISSARSLYADAPDSVIEAAEHALDGYIGVLRRVAG
jgi:hypothetical protein